MCDRNISHACRRLAVILSLVSLVSTATANERKHSSKGISIINYRGWADSYLLSNGTVEAVVAPAVGRVMQFHFVGEDDVFWENAALQGKPADFTGNEWHNFGGDKALPAPQDDWQKLIGRIWPPPATFGGIPLEGHKQDSSVVLVSPVDPVFGIKTRRRIELDPHRPLLKITTTFEKLSGDPVKAGVWIVTQLRDPQRAYIALPPDTKFPQGYVLLNFSPPQDDKLQDGLFSLTRGREKNSQIGNDGSSLLWMNEKYVLRIDSPRVAGAEYGYQGSSAVIYTNPDPDDYVELETNGPLTTMKIGDRMERTNTYILSRRTEKTPEAQAKKTFGTANNNPTIGGVTK